MTTCQIDFFVYYSQNSSKMSCDETAFSKLRECWSRHHKKDNMQSECLCCCSGLKTKSNVKGKFGIAYVIDTPNRKCKPCGWEVEFNDTLSEVENNCKKMMQWVTCPPLGECQNNRTNICCCSEGATKKLLKIQPPCCSCNKKDDTLCKCCKQKKKKSGGDGYYKKEQQTVSCCCNKKQTVNKDKCCCSKTNKTDNTNQCCCSLGQGKNQCCLKPKPTSGCCRARDGQTRYLESIKRCTECCCIISNEEKNNQCCCSKPKANYSDEECCCNKTKNKPICCCQDSDSQSSFESCECGKQQPSRKDCCCDCAGCKCTAEIKGDKRKKQKRDGSKKRERKGKKEEEGSKDKAYTNLQPSKNWQSPEPTKERHKGNEKSPFTLLTHKQPKKEPDLGQGKTHGKFNAELTEKVKAIKKPEDESEEKKQESITNFEMETQNDIEKKQNIPSDQPTLLQRIKQEHKKEINAIHPIEKNKDVVYQVPVDMTPEKPVKKRKLQNGPSLLKKIKEERKKEMKAINPKQQQQDISDKPEPAMTQTSEDLVDNDWVLIGNDEGTVTEED